MTSAARMRRVLILALTVVLALLMLVLVRQDDAPADPMAQLRDCTPGAIGAPSLQAIEPWAGTPVTATPLLAMPEPTSMSTADGLTLVTFRTGEVRTPDGELVWTEPDVRSEGAEQGLLDVLIDPSRGLIFTSLTRTDGNLEVRSRPITNPTGDEYGVVLEVEEPHEFHNGGDMELSPDGFMFLSLGDGGPSGDPNSYGQSLDTLLGSILRIDPTADGYSVPPDNPQVDGEPVPHWAYGVRNAWRISVDGDRLWIGDVGNWCIEEINVMPSTGVDAPVNFGWSAFEGTSRGKGPIPEDHEPPFLEIRRDLDVCAVVGGVVYRGAAIPDLDGMYVFSDYCRGSLMVIDPSDPEVAYDLGVEAPLVTSLAVDADGELVVMSQSDGVLTVGP